MSVVQGGENAEVGTLTLSDLPFVTCVWVSEGTFIAGGKEIESYLLSPLIFVSSLSYSKTKGVRKIVNKNFFSQLNSV